jgi:uncharacterized protein (TIGR04255 family)
MRDLAPFQIDTNETFDRLEHAPIVEAVLDIRSRIETTWKENGVRRQIEVSVPGYNYLDSQHVFEQSLRTQPGLAPEQNVRDLGWKGIRFKSSDGLHIAQFNRDGFVFSRLEPYETWDRFIEEALRVWKVYIEIGSPSEMLRIGVRFINRIRLPGPTVVIDDYILPHPDPPRGLEIPFSGYFQRDTLQVPGHPYAINITRALQLAPEPDPQGSAIILDIDVSTTQPYTVSQETMSYRLAEMRWLKNKAFLGSISEDLLGELRGVRK